MDAVGAGRFAVWGHSGGGGARARVRRAARRPRHASASRRPAWRPFDAEGFDWFAGMGEANIEEFGLMAQGRERAAGGTRRGAPGDARRGAERDVRRRGVAAVRRRPARDGRRRSRALDRPPHAPEGLRDSAEGWVDDDLAFTTPWGFDVGDVTGDVRIWQGEQDRFVPPAHAPLAGGAHPRRAARAAPRARPPVAARPAGCSARSWRRYRARRSAAATTSSSRCSAPCARERAAGLDADPRLVARGRARRRAAAPPPPSGGSGGADVVAEHAVEVGDARRRPARRRRAARATSAGVRPGSTISTTPPGPSRAGHADVGVADAELAVAHRADRQHARPRRARSRAPGRGSRRSAPTRRSRAPAAARSRRRPRGCARPARRSRRSDEHAR